MGRGHMPIGRRERAKQAKRERIMTAARELFAERGVSRVTTQQIARRADVANGTLYLYASTKAELPPCTYTAATKPSSPTPATRSTPP